MAEQKHVFLAEPRGFCFGVKKALQLLDKVIGDHPDEPIYVFNEIVHNKPLVDAYQQKGVVFTKEIDSIPASATVVISAHGCAPQIRDRLRTHCLHLIDATCPLVKKVHDEVHIYSRQGEHILYIGDPDHDEAKGVIAENPDNISVVYVPQDIERIPSHFEAYRVLNQTTLNLQDVNALVEQIRLKYPQVSAPPRKDVCFASTARQDIVRQLSQKCDLFLVIGSANSSNSIKLRNIAQEQVLAYLLDSADELDSAWLSGVNRIGLTAGASAPEYLVQNMLRKLNDLGYVLA